MNQLFRIVCVAFLSGVLYVPAAVPAFAAVTGLSDRVSSSSARGELKPTIQAKITGDLQQRAEQELSRRLTSLQNLLTHINNVKRLSPAQKTSLTSQVQQEIDSLKALQTKIQSDTDNATLKTDVQSIVKSYRVYALFIPEIYIITSADRVDDIAGKMSSVAAKLQTRITEAKTAGSDTATLQTELDSMNSQIADAQTQAQNAINTVVLLTPSGYPGNKTTLQSARSMIQKAHQDLVTAFQEAQQIVQGLHSLKTGSNSSSGSAHIRSSSTNGLAPSSSTTESSTAAH